MFDTLEDFLLRNKVETMNDIFLKEEDFKFTGKIEDDDDVIPLIEWLECCEEGIFIDYDGFGDLSDGERFDRRFSINPSDRTVLKLVMSKLDLSKYHVVWYNK